MVKFNDLDSAIVLARRMAARWPRQAGNLARVQLVRKEYDDVLVSCQNALDNGSAREAVQYATAAALARRDDKAFLKKVEEISSQGRNKSPNDHTILIFLATLRHVQARFEEELSFYRMALDKNPTNRQFLNNMAWTLCEGLNNPEEAFKQIEDLIKREGPAAQFLDTRGVIQIRRKNYGKAIEDLEKSAQLAPDPLTYFHLARAYFRAGKLADSRRCRDKALEKGFDSVGLDPTDRTDLDEVMGKP
jgi:tetratricopeptide (TPR) repeat protein